MENYLVPPQLEITYYDMLVHVLPDSLSPPPSLPVLPPSICVYNYIFPLKLDYTVHNGFFKNHKVYITFTNLSLLSVQLSGIKYIHIFLQSLPPSTSRTLSSSKAKTSDVKLLISSSSPASGNHHSLWTTLGPSCKWNHRVLILCHCLISHNTVSSGFIHVLTCIRLSFLGLNNISLYTHTTFSLSVHPLMNTWIASASGLLWIMLHTNIGIHIWIPAFNSFGEWIWWIEQ